MLSVRAFSLGSLRYLDLLEMHLESEGLRFARIDGSQRMKERERQIAAFHTHGVPILLMSLKCGVGLNLTAASTVILTEPWWNPFVEQQAVDRVHRIGQTKEVKVLRLVTPDTIEQKIVALQKRKQQLADETLGDGPLGGSGEAQRRNAAGRLSDRDIMRLLGGARPRG